MFYFIINLIAVSPNKKASPKKMNKTPYKSPNKDFILEEKEEKSKILKKTDFYFYYKM